MEGMVHPGENPLYIQRQLQDLERTMQTDDAILGGFSDHGEQNHYRFRGHRPEGLVTMVESLQQLVHIIPISCFKASSVSLSNVDKIMRVYYQ